MFLHAFRWRSISPISWRAFNAQRSFASRVGAPGDAQVSSANACGAMAGCSPPSPAMTLVSCTPSRRRFPPTKRGSASASRLKGLLRVPRRPLAIVLFVVPRSTLLVSGGGGTAVRRGPREDSDGVVQTRAQSPATTLKGGEGRTGMERPRSQQPTAVRRRVVAQAPSRQRPSRRCQRRGADTD